MAAEWWPGGTHAGSACEQQVHSTLALDTYTADLRCVCPGRPASSSPSDGEWGLPRTAAEALLDMCTASHSQHDGRQCAAGWAMVQQRLRRCWLPLACPLLGHALHASIQCACSCHRSTQLRRVGSLAGVPQRCELAAASSTAHIGGGADPLCVRAQLPRGLGPAASERDHTDGARSECG